MVRNIKDEENIKKKKEVQLGHFQRKEDIQLIKKFDNYLKLCNRNKSSDKVSRLGFIRNAMEEELEGKILDNNFIVPEKPYYFDMKLLLGGKTVKASNNKPSTDFEKYFTVKQISNNLDSFSIEFKTYCYNDNKDLHKGIYVYYNLYGLEIKPIALVFDYNSFLDELSISMIDLKDMKFLIESEEDVGIVEEILDNVNYNVKKYASLMESDNYIDFTDGSEDLLFYLDFISENCSVIEDFKGKRQIELLSKYGINEFIKSIDENTIDLDSVNLDSITTTEDVYKLNFANEIRNIKIKKIIEKEKTRSIDEVLERFKKKD